MRGCSSAIIVPLPARARVIMPGETGDVTGGQKIRVRVATHLRGDIETNLPGRARFFSDRISHAVYLPGDLSIDYGPAGPLINVYAGHIDAVCEW